MNNSKKLLALGQIYCRHFGKSAPAGTDAVLRTKFLKLKNIQKKFGVDDGVPVYIKSGFGDRILYQATFALTLVGVGLSLETFYRLTFGKE